MNLVSTSICVIFLLAGWNGEGVPSAEAQEECKVIIQNGTILGAVHVTSDSKRKICAYTAIPFAAPPIGPLRFKAPEPASAWEQPLNATSSPNWCPQGNTPPAGIKISEDCLYLNVFTPQSASPNDKLPVMLWIHGGSFVSGSSQPYTPTRLLARGDVVLVVIHYRLGMLGFLSTGDKASPGNYGLKDQHQAIRWVSENIGSFGGNSSQVTIFGESAGSASTTFQLISPLNKGLIHGAIAQSGTALGFWAVDRNPRESAKIMARLLGCPLITSGFVVNCLRTVKWEKIIEAQKKYTAASWLGLNYALATMTPVVEPDLPGAFISKEPLELMETGDIPNVPLVLGGNKHDGSFVLAMLYMLKFGPQGLDKNPEYLKYKLIPDLMKFFQLPVDAANGFSPASLELAYLDGVNRSSWAEVMPGLVDLITVFSFKSSIENMASILSRRNLSVYVYSFEHHSSHSLWPMLVPPTVKIPVDGGIAHADELIYLFGFPFKLNTADQSFSDLFSDMWLNFGRYGNPTPEASNRYDQWTTYNIIDESYMKLNATPKLFPNYRSSWRPKGFQWN